MGVKKRQTGRVWKWRSCVPSFKWSQSIKHGWIDNWWLGIHTRRGSIRWHQREARLSLVRGQPVTNSQAYSHNFPHLTKFFLSNTLGYLGCRWSWCMHACMCLLFNVSLRSLKTVRRQWRQWRQNRVLSATPLIFVTLTTLSATAFENQRSMNYF